MLRVNHLAGFQRIPGGNINADNFLDGIQAAAWTKTTYADFNASVTVVESNGGVKITPLSSTAGNNKNGYQSTSSYNFTGKYMQLELPTMITATGAVTRFGMVLDASNLLMALYGNGGNATFRSTTAGVNDNTTIAQDATNHRWTRIENSGANILWRTSPDGSTWTTQKTLATPITITSLKVFFLADTFQSTASPGFAVYRNFSSNLV